MTTATTFPEPNETGGHWLTRRRLGIYPICFVIGYALMVVVWYSLGGVSVDAEGKPYGSDFITFWTASELGLEGTPEAAFDVKTITDRQSAVAPGTTHFYLWHYPPTFQLITLPLALVPYFLSYILWVILTGAFALGMVWRATRDRYAVWLFLAAPAFFVNFLHGQTAVLVTALFLGVVWAMPKRPLLAGVFLGLLTIKPHFGVLIPVALLLARQWSVFASAAVTTLLFAGLTVLVFGHDLWGIFFDNLGTVRLLVQDGVTPWEKMPTVFAAVSVLGAPQSVAYAIHGVVAAAAAVTVFWVWSLEVDRRLVWAVLIPATLLISPYMFDYDLTLLLIPMGLIAYHAKERGWAPWEREMLVAAWLFPLVSAYVIDNLSLPIGPLPTLVLLALAMRRVRDEVSGVEAPLGTSAGGGTLVQPN